MSDDNYSLLCAFLKRLMGVPELSNEIQENLQSKPILVVFAYLLLVDDMETVLPQQVHTVEELDDLNRMLETPEYRIQEFVAIHFASLTSSHEHD